MKDFLSRIPLIFVFVMLAAMAVVSCKNPEDATKGLDAKIDAENKKEQQIVDQALKASQGGGQPGSIQLAGVIVTDETPGVASTIRDPQVSPAIEFSETPGTGADGSRATLAEIYKPVLSSKITNLDLKNEVASNSLISIGCDPVYVQGLAKERSLNIQSKPTPAAQEIMIVRAKTVILCGKIDESQFEFFSIFADELILKDISYTQSFAGGWTNLSTNKLVLMGKNAIQTSAPDSSMTLSQSPNIGLKVVSALSVTDGSALSLSSYGANYVPGK